MAGKLFKLSARINSANPGAIRPLLNPLKKNGTVREENNEFFVEASVEGTSAKELNRSLLSELRRAEKKTRLRAEWTSNGVTERYFDYVLKSKT